jgi:hypothetical protein
MLVGRYTNYSANQQKSCKKACTWWPIPRRVSLLNLLQMASCKEQKIPRDPDMANAMDRSSPITYCHFLVEVRRWVSGMLARMMRSCSTRWASNWIILVVVSITHPRTTLGPPCGCITFQQFLDGSRFLAKRAICTDITSGYLNQAVQRCTFHTPPSGCTSLYHSNKVVDVNTPLAYMPMDVYMLPLTGVGARLQLV